MITFLISLVALVLGYIFYGKFVENVFGIEVDKVTPAKRLADGVDYVEIDWKKAFLIQFLNIAGLGPIFGAVAGALWGPAAFLWIVFGCIFAGATHDYLSGMLSVRHDGATIAEIVGIYLGKYARKIMIVFSVILLVLVGVVFVKGPAGILHSIVPSVTTLTWVGIIMAYYIIATLVPVDKLIGKIYPFFGGILIFMAIGIAIMMFVQGYAVRIPELSFTNIHPKGTAIFPFLFITIACGAISGFHATQSPLMARCMKNEREGRRVFYGSMIAEGIIALIWAAAAMTFFYDPAHPGIDGLHQLAVAGAPGVVVNKISIGMLGTFGGALALLGVVACPITSGDTAFRSARLAIADAAKFKQGPIKNRLLVAIPIFAIGIGLCFIPFGIIWRYFAWSNQTLATIALWAGSVYLSQKKRNFWIATIPAVFMTAVVTTYIIIAPEGFQLSTAIGYPVGIAAALISLVVFLTKRKNNS